MSSNYWDLQQLAAQVADLAAQSANQAAHLADLQRQVNDLSALAATADQAAGAAQGDTSALQSQIDELRALMTDQTAIAPASEANPDMPGISRSSRHYLPNTQDANCANRFAFADVAGDANTDLSVMPNGAGNAAAVVAYNNSNPAPGVPFALLSATITAALAGISTRSYNGAQDLSLIFSTAGSERLRVGYDGTIGINRAAPIGLLHGYDTLGGFCYWEKEYDFAATKFIIPDGAGDVQYAARVMAVIRDSTGAVITNNYSLPAGTDLAITTSIGNTINLRVNADGSMDVRRTAGAATFKIALWMVWL